MRDWTGYSGDSQAKTPNLDRLAKSGVAFTRAYTAYALCNPSRTALLTGLRPSTTGVVSNNNDWREAVPPDRPTLPAYLRTNGYRTLGRGKIFHGNKVRREEWDEFVKDNQGEERDENPKDRKNLTLRPGPTPGSFVIGSNVVTPLDSPEEELNDYQTASRNGRRGRSSSGQLFDPTRFWHTRAADVGQPVCLLRHAVYDQLRHATARFVSRCFAGFGARIDRHGRLARRLLLDGPGRLDGNELVV